MPTLTEIKKPTVILMAWHKEKTEMVEIRGINFAEGTVCYIPRNYITGDKEGSCTDPIDKFSFKKKLVKTALGGWSSKNFK